MSYSSNPPSGRILSLLTTLSNPSNHHTHAAALSARDAALSSSSESYGLVCIDLARVLAAPSPHVVPSIEIEQWITDSGGMNVVQFYCSTEQGWSQLREMAGLLLKNALIHPPWDTVSPEAQAWATQPHLRKRMRLPLDSSGEIKQILVQGMTDSNSHVRKVSSTIIAACTVQRPRTHASTQRRASDTSLVEDSPLPLREWGDLPPFLATCLENGVWLYGESIYSTLKSEGTVRQEQDKIHHALMGSLQTLLKMLEDDPIKVEQDLGAVYYQRIVTCFISLLSSPRVLEKQTLTQLGDVSQALLDLERVKLYALQCCIVLIGIMPSTLVALMSQFLGILSSLSSDPAADVRKFVCRAIVSLLKSRAEFIRPHIIPISEFMLQATMDLNKDVALEACDFWLTLATLDSDTCSPEMATAVKTLLPRLIPVLVKGMIYPEEKIDELLEMNEYDERQCEDQAKDIAPVFHKSKAKGGGRLAAQSSNDHDDNDSDEDDGDDEDDDMFDERDWNLRTCSAAALDNLSVAYSPADILPHLLPVLQESLAHTNPWVCEAGVLALGAVSSGCYQELGAHMPQLHPFLMGNLSSATSLPQLRSISIWTLSRYVEWVTGQVVSGLQPDLLGRLVESLLICVSSKNRRVQLAACSAISEIVERAPELMEYYVDALFDSFSQVLLRYQTRSLLVLIDAIGTIADFVGSSIWTGSSVHRCISSMILIWGRRAIKNPFDRALLSLMESLACLSVSGGVNFQPMALDCFDNAMATIEICFLSLASSEYDADDTDPIVCATDLLDGLVEGLGPTFSNLVSNSKKYGPTFANVLKALIAHDISAVRMSGFALMGDVAKYSPITIHECIRELIQEAIYNLDPSHPLVCNNAIWALGEVCVKCIGSPDILDPFVADIIQGLIVLLMSSRHIDMEYGYDSASAASLAENAASTLGRLALVNPAFLTKDLPRCLISWCDGIAKISQLGERKDAFKGFIQAVLSRPNCVLEASAQVSDTLTAILLAIVSWHIPDHLSPTSSILHGQYKFQDFPADCRDLVDDIITMLHIIMPLIRWETIRDEIPVNVKVLLRDVYRFN